MKTRFIWKYRTTPVYENGRVVAYQDYRVRAEQVQKLDGWVFTNKELPETKEYI